MVTLRMPRPPGSDAASQGHRRTQWHFGRGRRAYNRVRRALIVVAVSLVFLAPLDLRFTREVPNTAGLVNKDGMNWTFFQNENHVGRVILINSVANADGFHQVDVFPIHGGMNRLTFGGQWMYGNGDTQARATAAVGASAPAMHKREPEKR